MDYPVPDWAKEMNCAVTVCDADCNIIYMNDLSRATFASYGADLVGRNLMEFHVGRSQDIIRRLLAEGGEQQLYNQQAGTSQLIYQTAWRKDGEVAGLVELSIVLPDDMPHYDRG